MSTTGKIFVAVLKKIRESHWLEEVLQMSFLRIFICYFKKTKCNVPLNWATFLLHSVLILFYSQQPSHVLNTDIRVNKWDSVVNYKVTKWPNVNN